MSPRIAGDERNFLILTDKAGMWNFVITAGQMRVCKSIVLACQVRLLILDHCFYLRSLGCIMFAQTKPLM
jgi:hypothetical protein